MDMTTPKRINPTGRQHGRALKSKSVKQYHTPYGFLEMNRWAAGHWEFIHTSLGVEIAHLLPAGKKNGRCQGCGGKDRKRLDKTYHETGRWCCNGGGDFQHGDGFDLLGHVYGWSKAEQLAAVKRVMGIDDKNISESKRRELAQQAAAHRQTMLARVRAKEERFRLDWNLICSFVELEDLIKHRMHCQRIVNQALSPNAEERQSAESLHSLLSESYGLGGGA